MLRVEILRKNEIKAEIIPRICLMTSRAWREMPDISEKWVNLADTIAIVKNDSEDLGFISAKILETNEILILALMVDKKFQNNKLSKILVTSLIKEIFFHPFRYKINMFRDVFFVLRTPNPRVYEMISLLNLYPSDIRNNPTKKEVDLANKVMHLMGNVTEKLDQSTFVIHGALNGHEDLIYDKNNYPRANNAKINNFFEKLLNYDQRLPDILMVVGRFNFFKSWRFLLKQMYTKI